VKPGVVAIALVVASALLSLTACTTAIPTPETVGQDEIAAAAQARLDATWAATGLDGTIPQPHVSISGQSEYWFEGQPEVPVSEPSDNWYDDIVDCLAEDDLRLESISADGSTFTPVWPEGMDGALAQLRWYTCFAASPPPKDLGGTPLLSAAEIGYISDYWKRWLIPCIAAHGDFEGDLRWYTDPDVVAHGEFTPYQAILMMGPENFAAVEKLCGPVYGIIDHTF